jgi:hypothetical protein
MYKPHWDMRTLTVPITPVFEEAYVVNRFHPYPDSEVFRNIAPSFCIKSDGTTQKTG